MLDKDGVMKRFEDKLERVPFSGCWIWLGALMTKGYGKLMLTDAGEQRLEGAHLVAWQLYRGDLPKAPLQVLHTCDVRCCVNPDHLFDGTNADNVADRIVKGRPGSTGRPPRNKATR